MVTEIAGQQWLVEKVESHHPGLFVEGTARRGACWCGSTEIYISNELKGDQAVRVVMHELAHAYIYSTQAVQPEAWGEEDVCEMFAIYALEMCEMCQVVCRSLFPEAKFRKYRESDSEVQV